MHGKSSTTRVVALRLPNDVYEIIKRRAVNSRYFTVSAYLRAELVYFAKLNHHKKRERYAFSRDRAQIQEAQRMYRGVYHRRRLQSILVCPEKPSGVR